MLNAADEVAVAAFLDGAIPFTGIAEVVERTLEAMPAQPVGHFEDLFAGDEEARERAGELARRAGARVSWFLAFAGFAVLIVLHEVGHFAAAKAVGMRVERFFLFFPPKLVSVRRGETEYGIGAIPLGGFVKITGMNPDEELPPEVAPPRLLPPAGLEADRRDRRGPGGEHRARLRDPLRASPSAISARRPSCRRPRSSRARRRPACSSPGDRIVSVDGVS